jgi:hypothetical protein
MIAEQDVQPSALRTKRPCELDDVFRIWPTINQIAKQHDRSLPRMPRRIMPFDAVQKVGEEINAPMDIADRVAPLATWAAGFPEM